MDIEDIANEAQENIDKENANNPSIKLSLEIVEDFLKTHRVMCYGGTAINNLLPEEDRFYNPDRDIPDYDFFSETPQLHATLLADRLTSEGFSSVEVKPGMHLGTFKVFADYIGVADISHMDESIFRKLWKESIEKAGIRYVPPSFLRMSMYLELSRPRGDVSRWKKVYSRLLLLNKHYEEKCPTISEEFELKELTPEMKQSIEELIIKEGIVLLGFNAARMQSKGFIRNWTFPLDLLCTSDKINKIAKDIVKILKERVRIKSVSAFEELIPAFTEIEKAGTTLIRIYETDACHSYHETSTGLKVASIPTLLQFFLSVLYGPANAREDIPIGSFMCAAQYLIELANNKTQRRYKLLTPISCIGKQKSIIDMKQYKSDLYEKLSKHKSSPEFLEYFFSYTPTSVQKTRRREYSNRIRKTLKKTLHA